MEYRYRKSRRAPRIGRKSEEVKPISRIVFRKTIPKITEEEEEKEEIDFEEMKRDLDEVEELERQEELQQLQIVDFPSLADIPPPPPTLERSMSINSTMSERTIDFLDELNKQEEQAKAQEVNLDKYEETIKLDRTGAIIGQNIQLQKGLAEEKKKIDLSKKPSKKKKAKVQAVEREGIQLSLRAKALAQGVEREKAFLDLTNIARAQQKKQGIKNIELKMASRQSSKDALARLRHKRKIVQYAEEVKKLQGKQLADFVNEKNREVAELDPENRFSIPPQYAGFLATTEYKKTKARLRKEQELRAKQKAKQYR